MTRAQLAGAMALVLLTCAVRCMAGEDTYLAFDRQHCRRFFIEFDSGPPPDGRARFDPNALKPQAVYWSATTVFSGNEVTRGLCKMERQTASGPRYVPVHCEGTPDFILSGASYAAASRKEPFNFRCKAHCGPRTPKWIYLEPNEVQGNPRHDKARLRYRQKCGD